MKSRYYLSQQLLHLSRLYITYQVIVVNAEAIKKLADDSASREMQVITRSLKSGTVTYTRRNVIPQSDHTPHKLELNFIC